MQMNVKTRPTLLMNDLISLKNYAFYINFIFLPFLTQKYFPLHLSLVRSFNCFISNSEY